MKKIVTIILLILAVVMFTQSNTATSYAQETETRKIIVSGMAELNVAPNIATIIVGVETTNADVAVAQSENTTAFNQLVTTLNSYSILENSIKTTHYGIQKEYSYSSLESVLIGYKVTNIIEFKTKQINDVGTILSALVENKANIVHGVSFSVDNESEFYQQALTKAVSNASSKAAALLGHTNFQVLEICEFDSNPIFPIMMRADSAKNLEATTIFSGNIIVRANIKVTYSF